jgi:hypothetical protein
MRQRRDAVLTRFMFARWPDRCWRRWAGNDDAVDDLAEVVSGVVSTSSSRQSRMVRAVSLFLVPHKMSMWMIVPNCPWHARQIFRSSGSLSTRVPFRSSLGGE